MTDTLPAEITTAENAAPLPASTVEVPSDSAESKITVDAENVLHDGEREARHGLSHLEEEFVAEFKKLVAYTEAEAKALLAWLSSKL